MRIANWIKIVAAATFVTTVNAQSISGVVTDEHGNPVAGATMGVRRIGQSLSRDVAVMAGPVLDSGSSTSTVSGSDGTVSVPSLTMGTYEICTLAPSKYYISECKRTPTPLVSLVSGKAFLLATPTLHTASNLRIYVKDANGRVSYDTISTKETRPNRLLMSVRFKSGISVPARAIAHSGQFHVFEVSIPTDEPVTLVVDSDLSVSDMAGSAIETNRISTRKVFSSGLPEMSISLFVK